MKHSNKWKPNLMIFQAIDALKTIFNPKPEELISEAKKTGFLKISLTHFEQHQFGLLIKKH